MAVSESIGAEVTAAGASPPARARRTFPIALVTGAVLVGLFMLGACFAPLLTQWDPMAQDLTVRLRPPAWEAGGSADHLLGTDSFGRDVWSQLLHGARYSLGVAIASTLLAGVIGVALALIAGYGGRWRSGLIMRSSDTVQSLPPVLLALMVAALFGNSVVNLTLVLAITSWPTYTRILYGVVRSVREQEFISASIATGRRPVGIIATHVLPNIASPVIVITTLQVGRMALLEAGLSFLGLGVPLTSPAWGTMLADGQKHIFTDFYLSLLPGLAITLVVGGVNLFGEGLRRKLNPWD